MKTMMAAAAAATLCLGLSMAPVHGQDQDDPILGEAMAFALHDAAFTMYHEIGHLLVGELGLPVLGKEEDAVDALATIWLLEFDEGEDSYDALIDAADGWYFNAVQSTGSGVDEFSYYDEHSLDIQRAYAMVCMMVGKDPEAFGETADIYEIDPDQQEDCGYTYEQAFTSWMALLDPHLTEAEAGASIEVIYEDAGDYEVYALALKDYRIMEYAAETVAASFNLPGPVTFRATQCGEPNAFYDPSNSEVIYCYEMAEHMFYMYLYDIVGWGDTAN
ncbi:DUF4344 domain-containing metallopeptidase [Devosia sp. XJ19-1]|uniref:DUF4344 domain-containing metallopeptidase n=1 Tax=Devosia ureilytica TaxID=2952754 RepID=A0A9Q4AKZ5_9HYPH|nr:DUF4344 domain-containing metallopeptidase [Devosia ureilytica]MCP8882570.1 DUF4344 domain-containing metallopeptidase [Devosia ureilytica]MCP8885543.1 DUF4344 domain-containing metallopeptidase [Devosia ureilytica]